MQKTLFGKHFVTILSIILLSLVLLGAVLLAFATQYFKLDRYRLLEHNARQAANLTYSNWSKNGQQYVNPQIAPIYTILANAIESDIYLVDTKGNILLFAQGSQPQIGNSMVPQAILQQAFEQGDYQELGRMGGLYAEKQYSVGVPIFDDQGQPGAVIFASASARTLTIFLVEILKMFVVSCLAVLILSIVAIYFITADLVRPLQKMVAATQSFSKGDFTMRVPVESYDELGQLAISFNNMATSLSTIETARRSFTANVSHELRTPMTTIGGFIDGILDGTIEEDKRNHYLQIVSQEIKRLSRLVRAMLNIARIEAGELEIKPDLFDLNHTVIQTVFSFEKALEEKNIEVRGLDHEKVMVEADPDLIHQVVYNLIENAVKFANLNGYIEVAYRDEEANLSIGIKNSGEGISRDEIPRVFDRFYKTDKSRSKDKGGAGLGLHIVRSIVNLHHGEILVRSVEGEYCEFVFTLPKPQPIKGKKLRAAEDKT